MWSGHPRASRLEDKNTRISNIMNLKLAEESRKNHQTGVLQNPSSNIRHILINTPSTHGTEKQFHSLQLTRRQHQKSKNRQPVHFSVQKSSGITSVTKILTVNEIKHHSRMTINTEQQNNSLRRQKSKGIFVSVSKRNSLSKQKKKEVQINAEECKMTHQQPKINQKMKINIYRDIARGRHISTRQQ